MRCMKCGYPLPEGSFYCPRCRTPVQGADYTSLESLLADEVKDALGEKTEEIPATPYEHPTTRSIDDERVRERRCQEPVSHEAAERKKRDAIRRQQQKRKRTALIVILSVFILGVLLYLGLYFYGNTYASRLRKADKAYEAANYEKALELYTEAAEKNTEKAEPYVGIGRCYLAMGDNASAEAALTKAMSLDADCAEAYLALAQLYESTGETEKITALFSGVTSSAVLKTCADYVAAVPEITPESGEYEEETTVEITATSGTIHYTADGSVPNASSPLYTEPITLSEDGHYLIRAVTVNDKGIIGNEASAEFTLTLPLVEGPSVSPASGQYSEATAITVTADEGLTVYYTLDGSTPTEASAVYTGPITMPQGETTFSCIAVSESGRKSSVIKRQYSLE